MRGGFLGEKGEQFLIRIGRSPGRHHPAEVAQRGVSRASPCGFMPGVLSVAGEVFSCPYDYIFLSGFQCALHGAVMDTGVLQTGIVYVDRKPVHTDGGLNSQLKWAVFRSTTVLDFHTYKATFRTTVA